MDDTLAGTLRAFVDDFGGIGAASGGLPTENILFLFTANGQQQYACQYDGHIVALSAGQSGNWGLSINADLPASAISVQSVYASTFVVPPTTTAISSSGNYAQKLSHPFKTGDTIKVRNYNAGNQGVVVTLQRS